MIHHGDCLEILPTLEAGSVDCCVTSPPYWGLRDYGTAEWDGGDEACDHRQQLGGEGESSAKQNTSNGTQQHQYRDTCGKCGATRIDQQLGLEKTPEEYVEKMVAVFREVRRVLKDDGTLWLNLGSSYSGGGNGVGTGKQLTNVGSHIPARKPPEGLKPKDLVGIPWMLAFALRADGWYLRSEIIWHKPNPMPESVTDRPTKSHEQIFLFAKSQRYYYDADAIKEPSATDPSENYPARAKVTGRGTQSYPGFQQDSSGGYPMNGDGRNKRSVWTVDNPSEALAFLLEKHPELAAELESNEKKDTWTVPTKSFKAAHFATFPPKLIEPCILAGCRKGGIVLDPFMGAGTTAFVARKLGCRYVGCELNADYIKLAKKRLKQNVLEFSS